MAADAATVADAVDAVAEAADTAAVEPTLTAAEEAVAVAGKRLVSSRCPLLPRALELPPRASTQQGCTIPLPALSRCSYMSSFPLPFRTNLKK